MKPDDIPQWAWVRAEEVMEGHFPEIQFDIARALLAARNQGRDEGMVTDEMVKRATDAFWCKEGRETENQTLRMRAALEAALRKSQGER